MEEQVTEESTETGPNWKGILTIIAVCFLASVVLPAYNDYQRLSAVGSKSESSANPAPEQIRLRKSVVDQIWNDYQRTGGAGSTNSGFKDIFVSGELVKIGTINPSAINSSAPTRLPAALACFNYVTADPWGGDSKAEMCVYHVTNTVTGDKLVQWRGPSMVGQLEAEMASDGFESA